MTERDILKADPADLAERVAAGRLTAAERAALDAAAAIDPDLAARLTLYEKLGEAARADAAAETQEWSPGEMGFQRLLRDIRKEGSEDAPVARAEEARPSLIDRVTRLERPTWFDSAPVWRVAAAAAFALLAAQTLYLAGDGPTVGPGAGYETAGGSGGARAGAHIAQATFAPEASEADLRAALRAVGARIVDGPSALGVYRLAFETEAARESAVSTLAASPLVASVTAD